MKKLRCGNVLLVKMKIDMKNLNLIYLLHFMYLPGIFVYALCVGEDSGSIGLYLVLTFVVSLILYLFNLTVTKISINYTTKEIIPFLVPGIILLILYIPVNWFLSVLDIGGKIGYLYILSGNLIINIFSYYKCHKKK